MAKSKRIIALALTLASVFALFAGVTAFAAEDTAAPVAAPAAYDPAALVSFPDIGEANVNYDLPLQFFAKVGLLQGTDGQMQPVANMTRAQAATIIARLVHGVANADALPQVSTGYVDVTANEAWASGYINFVTRYGLMVGTGNPDGLGDTFSPNSPMSIAAWEVVMLRLAGYGQANEFTGESWDYNADYWARVNSSSKGIATASIFDAKTAVVYEDYKADVTREQAYAFIWNLLWFTNEVSYQYGTYRTSTGEVAGGNTSGDPVAKTLGFGRGWLEDDEGFRDIVGEVYAYDKAAAGSWVGKKWFYSSGANIVDIFTPGGTKAVFTTDLKSAIAENRIYEVTFPIGPSTEQVRTAIRDLDGTSAGNWDDDRIFINGEQLGSATENTFADYLNAMSDRAPAFGYESEVRVWATPNALDLATRYPLRTTVKLPALAQTGNLIKDDVYTHLVNEAGVELDLLYSDPSDNQFNNREDDGGDIEGVLAYNSNPLSSYAKLAAASEGTYVAAYLMGITLTVPGIGPGTIVPGLNWTTGDAILTADIVTVETANVTSKRTGYITLSDDIGEVREATWLVGNSPVVDNTNYTLYRDRNGSVIGTNLQFVGNNPFSGILYIKDVDNNVALAGGSGISDTMVTAGLLGENTEYSVNAGATVQFAIDNTRAITSWLTGTSSGTAGAINEKVNKGDVASTLEGRFFKYSYSISSGEPVFRLQYLNPNQFAVIDVADLPKTEDTGINDLTGEAHRADLRSVTYLWTDGYNEETGTNGDARFVRTYTEKAPQRSSEKSIYTINGNDSGAIADVIVRLTNDVITDIGLIDPYEVAAPREFAFFTGKIRYTSSDEVFDYATFLMDGQFIERRVDKFTLDSNGSDNHVGFYSLVDTFNTEFISTFQAGPVDEDDTGFRIGFNGNNTAYYDGTERLDRYDINVRDMSSTVARDLGTIYPWARYSLWRDVIENISGEYTASLNSEDSLAINVEYMGNADTIMNDTFDTTSNVTQAWIIPDRYYGASDLDRLGLIGQPAQPSQTNAGDAALAFESTIETTPLELVGVTAIAWSAAKQYIAADAELAAENLVLALDTGADWNVADIEDVEFVGSWPEFTEAGVLADDYAFTADIVGDDGSVETVDFTISIAFAESQAVTALAAVMADIDADIPTLTADVSVTDGGAHNANLGLVIDEIESAITALSLTDVTTVVTLVTANVDWADPTVADDYDFKIAITGDDTSVKEVIITVNVTVAS